MHDSGQLRALHDTYVWEVNAAVGEGRLDLVWQLADQYLDEALLIVTGAEAQAAEPRLHHLCTGQRPVTAPPDDAGTGCAGSGDDRRRLGEQFAVLAIVVEFAACRPHAVRHDDL